MPDVTIIGGGPAGSTAAVLLARAGWDVTLVEQGRFPRDKVCGECLSALGFDVLTRLGLADEFLALGAVRLERCEVHAPAGRSLAVGLPRPMWGLSRHALDGMLLAAARRAGATIRQPVRCEGLEVGPTSFAGWHGHVPMPAGHAPTHPRARVRARATRPGKRGGPLAPSPRPTLRLRDLGANTVETVFPAHVILADGKAAFAGDPPPPTGDFGIKTHFADVAGPRDRIELFGVRGSYGGLAPIEGGRWNAAFSVPAARLKAARGDLDALFAELAAENATLARRLTRAERVGPWLASPLPRFAVREQWPERVIPVGNSAAALEPIGGEGMGLAMRSAELAAAALIASTAASTRRRGLAREFGALWRTRRVACRAAALAVSSRALSSLTLTFMTTPGVRRIALGLIGKVR